MSVVVHERNISIWCKPLVNPCYKFYGYFFVLLEFRIVLQMECFRWLSKPNKRHSGTVFLKIQTNFSPKTSASFAHKKFWLSDGRWPFYIVYEPGHVELQLLKDTRSTLKLPTVFSSSEYHFRNQCFCAIRSMGGKRVIFFSLTFPEFYLLETIWFYCKHIFFSMFLTSFLELS